MKRIEIFGWIYILVVLATVVSLQWFVGFNLLFLLVVLLQLSVSFVFAARFGQIQVHIIRSLIGGLFIFSGLVKGVDPLGTQYKIEDYFIAFGADWALSYAFTLSLILNSVEFVLGALVLFNVKIRYTSTLVLLMMVFFTLTTLSDALFSPVADCGCFGDFLTITNWQTFYKNLIIDAFVITLFLNRKRKLASFQCWMEWLLTAIFIAGFLSFQFYNLNHLPVWDFRDWQVGKKMVIENPQPKAYYLTYRNKQTGEEKEYLSPNYPYNDSVWIANWEFVSQRVYDPNPRLYDLTIIDMDGFEHTQEIIGADGSHFMVVMPFVHEQKMKDLTPLKRFINDCDDNNIPVILLTSSFEEEIQQFIAASDIEIQYFMSDDTELEAMIRSNPGLIWMNNGVIKDKWHFNDFPSLNELFNEL